MYRRKTTNHKSEKKINATPDKPYAEGAPDRSNSEEKTLDGEKGIVSEPAVDDAKRHTELGRVTIKAKKQSQGVLRACEEELIRTSGGVPVGP